MYIGKINSLGAVNVKSDIHEKEILNNYFKQLQNTDIVINCPEISSLLKEPGRLYSSESIGD